MQGQSILFTGAFCMTEEWIDPVLSAFPKSEVHYLPYFFSTESEIADVFAFEHTYPFISPKENSPYSPLIADFFASNAEKKHTQGTFGASFKILYQRIVDRYGVGKDSKKTIRPLIYDTHGLFLAEWLHEHFQTEIVVLIQHPLLFVHNWLQSENSLEIESLFSKKVTIYAPNSLESIEEEQSEKQFESLEKWQKALRIWLILAETVLSYQVNYPNWLFFKYSDFKENTERILIDICDMLDLNYSNEIAQVLKATAHLRSKGISQDAKPDYLKSLILETEEYLSHFFPTNKFGKDIF